MRTLLLLAALCLALPVAAQDDPAASPADTPEGAGDASATAEEAWRPTARGVRTLGGYVSAARYSTESQRSFYTGVAPAAGLFVADGLLVEAEVSGGSYHSRNGNFGAEPEVVLSRSSSVSGGLGARVTKFFGAPDARVFPFVGASAHAALSRSRSTDSDGVVQSGTYENAFAQVRGGVMVPIARNVGVEAQVTLPVYDSFTAPSLGSEISLSVGFRTFLY